MNTRRNKKPHGQLRKSQIITTFGPGAPLDLPNHSVLIGGLDTWSTDRDEIHENRLIENLRHILDVSTLKLYAPPIDTEDPTAPPTGITAWQFPEYFITQDVEDSTENIRSRRLVKRSSLQGGKFIDDNKKKQTVVPIRFVRACRKGHIGDIDWYRFVHRGEKDCRRPLRIEERGTSGDLSEVVVKCECGDHRQINEATLTHMRPLGTCDGDRPWLGAYAKEPCSEPNRLLVRSASNAYFPQKLTVISLPDQDEDLVQAVNHVWDNFLQYVETAEHLQNERRKKPVQDALEGYSDAEILAEIERRHEGGETTQKSIKQTELETLAASKEEIGEDKPQGNFFARSLPAEKWQNELTKDISRVVLVHRLREVTAQVGFTRFESSAPDVDGELEMGVERAALSKEGPTWLPAIENRGEGIFLGFKSSAIENWLNKPQVKQRTEILQAGFNAWKKDHTNSNRIFIGLPYIMLHSLSHLLLTAVSVECGYPASSITERIYASPDYGYGILLYTQSPDAEGTLGGLVEIGRHITTHLQNALELGKLCSYDPVCAQHEPTNLHERRFLHGAACHGCLLVAEPSCEQHNDFLDRALVVPTVDNLGTEFFNIS